MNRIVFFLTAIFVLFAFHLSAKENIYIKAVIDSLNEETSIDYIDVFHNDSLILTIDNDKRSVNKYDLLNFYNYDPDRDIELIYPDDSYYFVDNNTLYIYQTEIGSRLVVRLFDIRGNQIWEKYGFTRTGYNELDLETHRLHKGAYFLMFTNGCHRESVPFLITEDNVYNIAKDTIVTPPIIDEFENNYKFIAHKGVQNPDTLEYNRKEIISLDSLIFKFKAHNYYNFSTGKLIIEDVKVIVEEDDNDKITYDTLFFDYEIDLHKGDNIYCQSNFKESDTIIFCHNIKYDNIPFNSYWNLCKTSFVIDESNHLITNFIFDFGYSVSGYQGSTLSSLEEHKFIEILQMKLLKYNAKEIFFAQLSESNLLVNFNFSESSIAYSHNPDGYRNSFSSKTIYYEFIPGTSQIRIELYPE